jgi:DNA-binding transcriptional LysR family regulator
MLRKLEREVGADLLHRTGKGVELTEAGRVFLRHATAAVREADDAQRAVRELLGLERGTVRIGGGATATTYLIPPVVGAMRRQHPGLRFVVREAGSNAVAQAVASGELDLGIVTLPITVPDGETLEKTPLVTDELRLIAPPLWAEPPHLPAALRDEIAREASTREPTFRFKDLVNVPVVGFEAGSAVRLLIDDAATKAGVTLNYVMELRSIEGIKEMVAAGIGVAFVSRFALHAGAETSPLSHPPHPRDARLVGLALKAGTLSRTLAMVAPRDRIKSPAADAFAQELTRHLRVTRSSAAAK